jgi:hypothetical protein
MSAQPNPYAPPTARVDDVGVVDSQAEAIRQEYIKHEASVRSVGILYLISGVFGTLGALVVIAAGAFADESNGLMLVLGVVYLALSIFLFFVGRGVRRLESWARMTSVIFACIGLLGFPIGTLINGYILYLMLSAKGKRIFQPDYADIIAATPHIKYKTSLLVWILLAIILFAIGAAIVIPMMSG